MTIEVKASSSSRAKQKIHNADNYNSAPYLYEDNDSEPSEMVPSPNGGYGGVSGGNYESFGLAPSVNNSLLESSMDESQQQSLEPSPTKKKSARGQVLVHYHPQLGDTGYESTLLEQSQHHQRTLPDKYPRIHRAMNMNAANTTTRRQRDGETTTVIPKHIYPGRGMHTRMIDDAREESMNHPPTSNVRAHQLPSPPGGMSSSGIPDGEQEGNDEYNNAATRQIRRRVFRVAMERGIHDERRRKLLDADADVGGVGLRVNAAAAAAESSHGGANGEVGASFSPGVSAVASNSAGPFSPGSTDMSNGNEHQTKVASSHSVTDEGDMPLSTKPTTPKTPYSLPTTSNNSMEENLLLSPMSQPPSPPSNAPPHSSKPSYKTVVYNLIAANEPEKLVQIDRVMEKYEGREEELIKKLDSRYRRRKIKRDIIMSKSKDGDEENEGRHGGSGGKLAVPVLDDSNSNSKYPPIEIKTAIMTSPAKLTFVKVNSTESPKKDQSALMAMQSWDRSEGSGKPRDWDGNAAAVDGVDGDGIVGKSQMDHGLEDEGMMAPPKIMKRTMPAAISDSTKTDLHANNAKRPSMSMMMETDDDNHSGMIPIPNISKANAAASNVENLGNQVVNERKLRERKEVMKERLERGRVKESLIATAVADRGGKEVIGHHGRHDGGENDPSSPRLKDDHSLKMANSYGDGISVMTMETKGTLAQNRAATGNQRVGGDGEAIYGFEERPPSNITVDSSSASKEAAAGDAAEIPKVQRVIPMVETHDEKAMAEKASLEASAKLDNVEARIRARQDANNNALMKADNESDKGGGALMQADDELDDMKSLFQEAKSKSSSVVMRNQPIVDDDDVQVEGNAKDEEEGSIMNVIRAVEDEHIEKNEEEEAANTASPPMIESILSSFDEGDDQEQTQQQQDGEIPMELQSIALSAVIGEEELQKQERVAERAERAQLVEEPDIAKAVVRTIADEGDTNTMISTASSCHSAAERAIAAATRSEIRRQKEVAEFTQRDTRPINKLNRAATRSSATGSTTTGSATSNNDNLEVEIARLIAEKESRFQAEKAVALMKAQRELERERRARLEAEAARSRVEEELERLQKLAMVANENKEKEGNNVRVSVANKKGAEAAEIPLAQDQHGVPVDSSEQQQRSQSPVLNARMQAEVERLQVEQELQRLKLETMANEAEAARLKAEEELELLKSEKAAKEKDAEAAARVEAEDEELVSRQMSEEYNSAVEDQVEFELEPPEEVIDHARLEAEAARHEAEQEYEKLKLNRIAARAREDAEEDELANNLVPDYSLFTDEHHEAEDEAELMERMSSDLSRKDEVENFRHGYSSSSDDDSEPKPNEAVDAISSDGHEDEELPQSSTQTDTRDDRIVADGEGMDLPETTTTEPLIYSSDSNRSSPELDEPPTISRTPEGEIEGVLSQGSSADRVPKNGHDFPSANMFHEPIFPVESEPADTHVSDMAQEDQPSPLPQSLDGENKEVNMAERLPRGSSDGADQASKDEHDFPSTTMAHAPKIPQESEPAVTNDAPNNKVENNEDGEAQIHHVARVTFEGDRSKGQLSFTTGSKVEAHSNQRGPWWLGRCGGRTGWFPASAVIPASKFLGSVVNSPSSNVVVDQDEEREKLAQLSGAELNAVYDLIRNPSDPLEPEEDDGDSDDERSGSPAKSRWLDGGGVGKSKATAPHSRDYSPPPSRLDPSEMAGLSERLYESHDDYSSNENDIIGRSPGEVVRESKSAAQEADETLSKDEPSQAQSVDLSKNDATDVSQPQPAEGSKVGPAKDSSINVNATKPKPKPEWRATKDPKSGLVYYYHTGTRKTTWEKPPDYVAKQDPAKSSTRAPASKDKSKRGRGIMGFLTKITKAKPEAETASESPDDPKVVKESAKKIEADAKIDHSEEVKLDTLKKVDPQHQTSGEAEKLPADELAVETESQQTDFWLTLDDTISASDESEHSESTEATETSMFSKRKIKTTVGKWAGKITEKLNNQSKPSYETMDNGTERQQDTPKPFATDQSKDKSSSTISDDELPTEEEKESKPQYLSEDDTDTDHEERLATEEKEQVPKDITETEPDVNSEAAAAAAAENINEEPKNQIHSSDTTVNANNVEATKEGLSKEEANRKKTQWRSAIDAATGRTYYYIRGTKNVTWEKPLAC